VIPRQARTRIRVSGVSVLQDRRTRRRCRKRRAEKVVHVLVRDGEEHDGAVESTRERRADLHDSRQDHTRRLYQLRGIAG